MLKIKEDVSNENVNPEPDWSLLMFWEDITAILVRIFEFIKSVFVPAE